MQAVTTIGLDIAKSVFQVHGVDAQGDVVFRRKLKRRYVVAFFHKLPRCLVGIEACASSHHWARELQALGHMVRLMPPAYVKPYVKRHENDAATDCGDQCDPRASCRVRHRRTSRPQRGRDIAQHRGRYQRQTHTRDRTGLSRRSRHSATSIEGPVLDFDRLIMAWEPIALAA
jgi:transposase